MNHKVIALNNAIDYVKILDEASDPLVTLNSDYQFTYANKAFAQALGKPLETIIGNDLWGIYQKDGADFRRDVTKEVFETGQIKVVDNVVPKPSGNLYFITTFKPIFNEQNIVISVVAMAKDITDRKQAEEAVRVSEVRFRELFNHMSSGVAVYEAVDNGGDFIFRDFNPAAEKIEKVSRQDILNKRVSEAFPGVKSFGIFEVFQRVWQTGKSEYFPQNIYKDELNTGSWRETWVVKLPTGEIVAVYNDITDRKQAEEALEKERRRLQQALDEVRTLRGIFPICTNCKKIRDDKGFWNQVEKYVSERTEAEFSHGICPECAQKVYPDIRTKNKIKVTRRPVILLVDDEEGFRMIFIRQIKKILKDQEFEFIEASDGEEALELLKGGAKPSIIILDYAMPKINGMELLKRIDGDHNDLYDVPRIMISGYSQKEIISEAQTLRCVFFEKSMDNIFYQQICQYMTNTLFDLAHNKGV